jgi:hypothetical protein
VVGIYKKLSNHCDGQAGGLTELRKLAAESSGQLQVRLIDAVNALPAFTPIKRQLEQLIVELTTDNTEAAPWRAKIQDDVHIMGILGVTSTSPPITDVSTQLHHVWKKAQEGGVFTWGAGYRILPSGAKLAEPDWPLDLEDMMECTLGKRISKQSLTQEGFFGLVRVVKDLCTQAALATGDHGVPRAAPAGGAGTSLGGSGAPAAPARHGSRAEGSGEDTTAAATESGGGEEAPARTVEEGLAAKFVLTPWSQQPWAAFMNFLVQHKLASAEDCTPGP